MKLKAFYSEHAIRSNLIRIEWTHRLLTYWIWLNHVKIKFNWLWRDTVMATAARLRLLHAFIIIICHLWTMDHLRSSACSCYLGDDVGGEIPPHIHRPIHMQMCVRLCVTHDNRILHIQNTRIPFNRVTLVVQLGPFVQPNEPNYVEIFKDFYDVASTHFAGSESFFIGNRFLILTS